uniref:Uncharacterized protein n=1 Tax=Oryza nivara TaxID=4536 RepID=A0A0E0I6U7_ORYNI
MQTRITPNFDRKKGKSLYFSGFWPKLSQPRPNNTGCSHWAKTGRSGPSPRSRSLSTILGFASPEAPIYTTTRRLSPTSSLSHHRRRRRRRRRRSRRGGDHEGQVEEEAHEEAEEEAPKDEAEI